MINCVCGNTLISTVYHGLKDIEWLANNKKEERFPIYCYDFEKEDYTIGWAYSPRFAKIDQTVQIVLDNGTVEIVTPDHQILKRDGVWICAGDMKFGDELMPFYRVKANQNITQQKTNQFPRIYTHRDGWIHERQFIDEWRLGKNLEEYDRANKVSKLIAGGLNWPQIEKIIGHEMHIIQAWLQKQGTSYKEIKQLAKNPNKRRVIGIRRHKEMAVYDLSVEDHKNFCTNSVVMHNCQAAPKSAMHNKTQLGLVTECACYACIKVFPASEIKEWTDDWDFRLKTESPQHEHTAICPYCDIDAVLPIHLEDDKDLMNLKKIHDYWV